ncbi:protein kinase-like protein rad3 [Leptodontidium sp. MPI-SDFR-AT-0119]|nr:protein kinase-like protein rad3 [Leptodontidium sp. MPI-SDFR-AT-0119]
MSSLHLQLINNDFLMMAPTARNTASSRRPNGHTNGEMGTSLPPPSTMAAQLISDLSTKGNNPATEKPPDALQIIINELSADEQELAMLMQENPAFIEDMDIKLVRKHKLIYTFTRALLEKLASDDPFMDVQEFAQQGNEALEIYVSTIKECPQLLAYTPPPDQILEGRGTEPLCSWLIPRVLVLLGRKGCEKLMENIKALFDLFFQIIPQYPNFWCWESILLDYLKGCVKTTIGHIQGPGIMSHKQHVEILVRPDKDGSGSSETSRNTLLRSSYSMRTPAEGLAHASHILCILARASEETAMSFDAATTFQSHLTWLLDSFLLLHEIRKRWAANLALHESCMRTEGLFLGSINSLLSSLRPFVWSFLLRKGYAVLSIICAAILEDPSQLSEESQQVVCSALLNITAMCKEYGSMRQVVSLNLLACVALRQACGDNASPQKDGMVSCPEFEHPALLAEFQRLGLDQVKSKNTTLRADALPHIEEGPPTKRRKINDDVNLFEEITADLYELLGAQRATDLAGLHQLAETCFTALKVPDQCKAVEYLGRIPCALSGKLSLAREKGKIVDSRCSICDGVKLQDVVDIPHDKAACSAIAKGSIQTFTKLMLSRAFAESRRPRVLAMFALKRFATHFTDPEFLDLEVSPLGQWCLKSLKSSIRELRLAAGRTIPSFLHGVYTPDSLTWKNRHNVIGVMRTFAEQGSSLLLQETTVLAWGQIAGVVKNDDLNAALLALVECLGHSNQIVSGTAFGEILRLANQSGLTVERLFSAFWSSIATVAVKDLLVKPQTTQLMADLLGISVTDFLLLTQSYTLPFLVLNGKVEVINRISEARQDPDNWAICLDPSNLAPILALLLVQDVPNLDSFVMGLFRRVSSTFKDNVLSDLLRIEPMYQALYLLKAAGEASESRKPRIRVAIKFLATRGGEINNPKRPNSMSAFLNQHILGLVTRIVEAVNGTRDEHMITERERSIKAMEELVKLAKTDARAARPQLCACLQTAFSQIELQSAAFSAWETILRNLGDEDVEAMLESTFSIVIQHWASFDETTQDRAESALLYLLKFRTRLIRNMIVNLPSLAAFPKLADVERQINKLRVPTDIGNAFQIFRRRLGHENPGVVTQALVELKAYLQDHQSFLQASAVSEQPDIVVGQLVRSVLDTCVKYNELHNDIALLSAECIGLIGCIDSNRVESVRDRREMVVVSNFHDHGETTDFVLYIMEEVIVPAFLSAEDTSLQGFFSYVMQELLDKCNFRTVIGDILRKGEKNSADNLYLKWMTLSPGVQDVLTPFLSSMYGLADMEMPKLDYPIFRPDRMPPKLYNAWLRSFTLDLLQKPFQFSTNLIFPPLCRAIRIKDVSVASFILPYLVLHVVVDGRDSHREEIGNELLSILNYEAPAEPEGRRQDLKLCIEAVFRILDYFARWMQEKQIKAASTRGQVSVDAERDIMLVKSVVETIPPELISRRAIECKSYPRALFYWEQHIRDQREKDQGASASTTASTAQLQRLQDIYTQIDEPDGIEGISAHLHVLDIDQQILGHRKAGRWTAAQSWYEIQLAERPEDVEVQLNLLTCLKESGQHDVLLNYVEGMHTAAQTVSKLLPFAAEASWATGRWATLAKYTSLAPPGIGEDFNVNIGRALLALQKGNEDLFTSNVKSLRDRIARSLSNATTSSLGACHDTMLKLHVLTELEMIAGTGQAASDNLPGILESLNRRLEVIGAFLNDKQYLLGIRRAAMQLSRLDFGERDIASAWLTSARLARKGNAIHQSFNAVLHASQLGDESATIEHARLLWKEGHHRKAIQSLQGAIENNAFISHNKTFQATSFTGGDKPDQQNLLTARAHLLYAKWLDSAGQTHSSALRTQYQLAAKTHVAWEKGHYYLGRHYNKLLESEKALPPERQNETLLTGETAKLVIENYFRALSYGTKYIYQTLPRILTLWLDLGTQVQQPIDAKYGSSKEFVNRITGLRKTHLDHIHQRFSKYTKKLPAYMFYTALPQIVARIAHSNIEVYKYLQNMIFTVVATYPQQALWGLLAVCTSNQSDRRARGATILQNLRKVKKEAGLVDFSALIKNGERITEQLLWACTAGEFQGNRTVWASLTKDLNFNPKVCMPSLLAVPVESVLTATLPTLTDNLRSHKAFSRDIVTISSFLDEVMILSSLQKPRKLTARGSDGRSYGLMCKPKDDLRKDQRLMEFNSMINRSLKRDAESSRRQLYIKTYAVTPLNEECGIIEWVDGLKTLRDILLGLYKTIGVVPNYNEIALYCEEAAKSPDKLPFFTEKILGNFPPMFHRWFVAQFPEPSTWFAARLRYTRSCAVMSMVGTILGLGDRHGENILFEEGNGGIFHVDFNCLFDKGLTFVKPERVPFRLTHNMIDAMGMYGYEGPFRKSSELTLKLLRQHEETLMTILEAFVYDPTLDLLARDPKKKKKEGSAAPQTAQNVLDTIQRKVRGLLAGESVPLGVEGQVDELIKQATNQTYLASMYIGWCSFF